MRFGPGPLRYSSVWEVWMWKWLGVLVPWMLACAGAGERKQDAAPTCCEEPGGPSGARGPYWSYRDAATCEQVGGKMVSKAECAPTCCELAPGGAAPEDEPQREQMPAGACRYWCCGEGRTPVDASFCP